MPFSRRFDFRTFEKIPIGNLRLIRIQSPLSIIPVVIRSGSIFAIKNWTRRTIYLTFRDPFCLIVVLNGDFVASGDLYVDD
jgi:alpha-glucosidase (family GH31 glycosyl hydrolase)